MWRGNPGRSDPSWNRPLHTHSDGWDTPSVRRFNSKLIGKIFSLKWAVTELHQEKAHLQRLLSSLDYDRSSIRAVLEQVKTERDKLLADLEEVRTERDTILAARRASDGIMQRKQNLSSCFMSSAGADYEQFESKSAFASVIAVTDKCHTTLSSFPWDGFYEPKAERDPASPHPPPNLADKEEEYSPASSSPRADLNADEKDEFKRRLLTQRGPTNASRLALDGDSLFPVAPNQSSSEFLARFKHFNAGSPVSTEGMSPVFSTQADSRCAGLLKEATIPADLPDNDPEALTTHLTSGGLHKVCDFEGSNSGTETDCLDEGAQTENGDPVHSNGDDSEVGNYELEEEGATTKADDSGPTQPNPEAQDDVGSCSTDDNDTQNRYVRGNDTEQDQPMVTLPTEQNTQTLSANSLHSGKHENERSRIPNSSCSGPGIALPTSSSDGDPSETEVPYPNDALQEPASDGPIGPVIHARSSGNILAGRMRSPLNDHVRGQKFPATAQSPTYDMPARHAPDIDARATRSFERESPGIAGDMTGRRPMVHGPGSYESDGEDTWGSDFSRMDETRRGSPCHNTERYTHVTYCCWCINQFLQSKAVALCGRCPRIMCRICASGWGLVIPTGQRSRDILLPYWCCRCTQRDSHFPQPHRDCQLEASLLEHLIKHDLSLQFRKPVDIKANPNYLSIITHDKMMDLSTIALKMERRHYMTVRGQRLFQSDLQQVWINCWKYAGYDPNSDAPVPGVVACTLILIKMVSNFYESHIRVPTPTFDGECWLAVEERIKHGVFGQIVHGQVQENPRFVTAPKPAEGPILAALEDMKDSEECE